MKVAFGLKAHSGWAALVVVGQLRDDFVVVDRRRLELVEKEWQKQPYHAAEDLKPAAARALVTEGIAAAHRIALQEIRAAVARERKRDNEVEACGVLVGNPMPDWSIEEILAVHFRMHKAEGVLFRDVLMSAANACALRLAMIPEKLLADKAEETFETSLSELSKEIAHMGKSVGPPWGKDQKDATLAAMVALRSQAK